MAYITYRNALFASVAAVAVVAASPVWAQSQLRSFNVPAQPAASGVQAFARQADVQILVTAADARGRQTAAVQGEMTIEAGLRQLLNGSGLTITSGDGRAFTLGLPRVTAEGDAEPQEAAALDDVIVTAQKREQAIQDVPIAITAMSSEALEARNIEGGSELLRAVPNVSFSKANFSMYNFSIRGIGTKAVSSSSDPAVAVSFNNTPLIRNRLFEQEYLDVQRVEVLRGPQGTLYGRNATAGVVNMIPRLPGRDFEGEAGVEFGNYDTRRMNLMLNVPVTDAFALRFAGATTQRSGFDYNTFNQTHVNDRDLWTTRLSALWEPTDRFSASLVWEHFEEDDNRARTGKQLCHNDPGLSTVRGVTVPAGQVRQRTSPGCLPGSLYDDAAFGVPNGGGFPHVAMAGLLANLGFSAPPPGGMFGDIVQVISPGVDPYAGLTQSRNLREIATSYDPRFRATNDVVQLNLEFAIADQLTLYTQTAWARDEYYSTQDYNRFVSNPVFNDSSQLSPAQWATPGGYFTDPQLGTSNRMISADLSQSDNRQWYQEVRLQSDFDGPFNFSVGANYLDFQTEDNYYVFNNVFTANAQLYYNNSIGAGTSPVTGNGGLGDILTCGAPGVEAWKECVYVDPTSIENLAGDGHNYFRSKNEVGVRSWAVFGEGYWQVGPELRLTAGLRYTDDQKTTTPYPSQLLLGSQTDGAPGPSSGGYYSRGYRPLADVVQQWGAVTGRLVVDWAPDLSFTDDTLVYASLSRGYKGGGTNPPRIDLNPGVVEYLPLAQDFAPEYVNALEIGTKNTLLDGRLSLNTTAFFYDYKDYQVSQIVDRISLNENFDATIWGAEIEAAWRPTEAFRLDANLGFLKTRIADGEGSVDVMNRTQGNEDWVVLKPWLQVPSNCVAPAEYVERVLTAGNGLEFLGLAGLCAGSSRFGSFNPTFNTILPLWQFFGFTYNPLIEAPNAGRGFSADLSGNELPNSPNWTVNIGAQHTFFLSGWELTVRGDYYWQDASYFRVYNTEYDRIRAWDSANLSVTLDNADRDLSLRLFVKNVFDDTPIVDAFTNSDDTGLTTNVFTLDPRLIAFSVSKRF